MTLRNVIKDWGKSIVFDDGLVDDLEQAILSWFKEQLPKEKTFENIKSERTALRYKGYNQCLQDIINNLETSK